MKVNQHQTVFVCAGLFLAWWVWLDSSQSTPRGSRGSKSTPELISYPAPDLGALQGARVDPSSLSRDLFSPPRDTQPLAKLGFAMPPVEALAVLAPPASGGPDTRAMAPFLRRTPVSTFVPGLFAETGADLVSGEMGAVLEGHVGTEELAELKEAAEDNLTRAMEILAGVDSPEAQRAMSQIRSMVDGTGLELDLPEMTAGERIVSYRALYDWIQMPTQRFGRIVNADRFRLKQRVEEALLFVEIDPETGSELFPGQAPIPYERQRLVDFGFAGTLVNELALARVALGDEIRPSNQTRALELATRCLASRDGAEGSLDMAEELCQKVVALEKGEHLEGRLLLAQVYEARFSFEEAFGVYNALKAQPAFAVQPGVWVAMGHLYHKLGMRAEASSAYLRALELDRSNAHAHHLLGRLLLDQGHAGEALPHLQQAEQFEPRGVQAKQARLAIRLDHGRALLTLGRGTVAMQAFQRALNLDPSSAHARAGLLQAARLYPAGERSDALETASGGASDVILEANFDLSLVRGLTAIELGSWAVARRQLELAGQLDPFRSHLSLAGLAFLAEQTGHPDRALEYLDQALEVYPPFAWAHYTRARILTAQDDLTGAQDSLRTALELELDFPDALVAMAVLERKRSEFDGAGRYLERALQREPGNASWWTLEGFNAYDEGDFDGGRAAFLRALEIDGASAAAGMGEAWWHYAAGDSEESITRMGEWVEKRRMFGETDPYVMYASAQSERIVDHDAKEVWTDRFERRPGRIGNGWSVKEGVGPLVELRDGAVSIQGLFTGSGRTRIYNELSADAFISMEANITIGQEHRGSQVGFFLARERTGHSGDVVVQSEVSFQRTADGTYQYRVVRQGDRGSDPIDIPGPALAVGETVQWTIEKVGQGSEAVIRMYVNGEPVVEFLPMPTLGSSTQVLRFGLFVEGQTNRAAHVTMDDVRVVRRHF
ncbi:MAG: tetratricopeptide repeat protein [Planctomycetes bacterium]|nr:tetratricopeptide repeat protein [Planctomycetota bacterium]